MTGASVRSTRQRAAISTLLETLDEFRSAQELHDELRRRGQKIGLTTGSPPLQAIAAGGNGKPPPHVKGQTAYHPGPQRHPHPPGCCWVRCPPDGARQP